jgi:hypothetical protein
MPGLHPSLAVTCRRQPGSLAVYPSPVTATVSVTVGTRTRTIMMTRTVSTPSVTTSVFSLRLNSAPPRSPGCAGCISLRGPRTHPSSWSDLTRKSLWLDSDSDKTADFSELQLVALGLKSSVTFFQVAALFGCPVGSLEFIQSHWRLPLAQGFF